MLSTNNKRLVNTQLFIPTNAQAVKTLHRQFCANMFQDLCAIFRESCTKLYVKFCIKLWRMDTQLSLRHYFGENCSVIFFKCVFVQYVTMYS